MISIRCYQGNFYVEISILIGTICGLPLRYFLEKRYIFLFQSKDLNNDSKLLALYSLMGVITTFIFWGFEFAFHKVFEAEYFRYIGALLGLSIGFYIKYRLDKKFVFVNSSNEGSL